MVCVFLLVTIVKPRGKTMSRRINHFWCSVSSRGVDSSFIWRGEYGGTWSTSTAGFPYSSVARVRMRGAAGQEYSRSYVTAGGGWDAVFSKGVCNAWIYR